MSVVAWWHCFSGIAGDMALASLVDAGADVDQVVAGLETLPVEGWHVEATKTTKCGLAATQLRVDVGADETAERTWASLREIIDQAAGLPERARRRAQVVFARLANAEAHLHGVAPERVHFHEVGGVDALIDIVGTCLALELLDVSAVYASSVAVGTGSVRSAHGLLPNPAPAALELLAGVPVHGTSHDVELTTPTGAALLVGLCESFGSLPAMKLKATGYGAGTRDLPGMPNVLQVVVGEPAAGPAGTQVGGDGLGAAGGLAAELVLIEANVDDVTGEVLAHSVGALMSAGALDAWLVPVVGKKGRPGHVVSVLAEPELVAVLSGVLFAETGTLGLRQHHVARLALPRRVVEVDVGGQVVRVKVGPYRAKAEHDDCARAAGALGLPVGEVAREAERAAAGQPLSQME